MPAPTPLPDELIRGPFRTSDLDAHGLGPGVVRGRRLQPVTHGAHMLAGSDPGLSDRCRALGLVIPGDVSFSHQTGSELLGLPEWSGTGSDAHVTRPPGSSQLRRAGVVQHRAFLEDAERWSVEGLAVTSPVRTLLDLAQVIRVEQLVATGDVAMRRFGVSHSALLEAAEAAGARRGVRAFREAIALMDARAQSPQESLVRVWCVVAELPYLEPQGEVVGGDELVATVDLLDRKHLVAVEYEGAHHRERDQFAYDVGRYRRVRRCGYEVVQIEASMMSSPRAVVLTIADEMRRRGWAGRPNLERLARLRRPGPR
jgi:hypothetical protein